MSGNSAKIWKLEAGNHVVTAHNLTRKKRGDFFRNTSSDFMRCQILSAVSPFPHFDLATFLTSCAATNLLPPASLTFIVLTLLVLDCICTCRLVRILLQASNKKI